MLDIIQHINNEIIMLRNQNTLRKMLNKLIFIFGFICLKIKFHFTSFFSEVVKQAVAAYEKY